MKGGINIMNGVKRSVFFIFLLLILSGCENKFDMKLNTKDLFYDFFKVNAGSDDVAKSQQDHLYSDFDREKSVLDTQEINERFEHKIVLYRELVDRLWESDGFYKNADVNLTDKEAMIDFYLFTEYHKDSQMRNLYFPEFLQKDLLLIEALFLERSIEFIESREMDEYSVLRDDLVVLYRNMYREELLNILYEGLMQVDMLVRVPNVIDRYNAEIENVGIKDRLRTQLGIPDTVISRGMGLDLITLYSDTNKLPEGDTRELAIILTMEMRLTGISMRLDRFFHVTNSLEGLGKDLKELRRDAELIPSGGLGWSRERMLRSIDYLEDVYLFYKGEKKYESAEQIFIDLQTREDFYALGMLTENIKIVMDKEDYWEEVESIRQQLVEERYLGDKK